MSDTDEDYSVTFLTEYFHPEGGATAQLLTELASELSSRFDVSAVTGMPNYLDKDRDETVPRHETHEGVDIMRVPATRLDKDSLPFRTINWLSFTLLATIRLLWSHRRDDAVITLSNPPIAPFAAWLHHRLTGTPYVYLVHDVYPDMAVELGYLSERHPVTRLWDWGLERVYCDADRIVVLGEAMRERLKAKLADEPGFDPGSIEVIPNWENEKFVAPMPKRTNDFASEHGTVETFTLLYSGNVGRFHEIETAIDAIGRLEERGRTDVQLLIIGEGADKERLQDRVDRNGIENVRFLPFQPYKRLPETLTCGDASLVGVKSEVAGLCVSSKLYSSLAAGRPVLGIAADDDEVSRIVENCDCGVHVQPGDVAGAARTLAKWADDPDTASRLGDNARACLEDRYTLNHASGAYASLLTAVVR